MSPRFGGPPKKKGAAKPAPARKTKSAKVHIAAPELYAPRHIDITAPFARLPIEFVGSFPDPSRTLDPPLPEVAFVGRSNVGKSSLLNALTGIPGLARVSSTPGKTALVNVFRLPDFHLVDLPGYGFAQASKSVRHAYRELVTAYLTKRAALRGVVWLLDSRHEPSKEDREFQEILATSGQAVLAVLTKADKLGVQAQRVRLREIGISLDIAEDQLLLVSSNTGLGLADLGLSITALVTHASPDQPSADRL